MEQYGLVTEDRGETAVVALQRHLTCENCGRCGILSGSNRREMTVEALNPIRAGTGRRVRLETDDRRVLFISFMLYLVPLAALLCGIFAWLALAARLDLAGSQDLSAVAFGFVIMALFFVFIRAWDRRAKDNPAYKPVITALVEGEDTGCEEK